MNVIQLLMNKAASITCVDKVSNVTTICIFYNEFMYRNEAILQKHIVLV